MNQTLVHTRLYMKQPHSTTRDPRGYLLTLSPLNPSTHPQFEYSMQCQHLFHFLVFLLLSQLDPLVVYIECEFSTTGSDELVCEISHSRILSRSFLFDAWMLLAVCNARAISADRWSTTFAFKILNKEACQSHQLKRNTEKGDKEKPNSPRSSDRPSL